MFQSSLYTKFCAENQHAPDCITCLHYERIAITPRTIAVLPATEQL